MDPINRNMYDLPKTDFKVLKDKTSKIFDSTISKVITLLIVVLLVIGFYTGFLSLNKLYTEGSKVLQDLGNSLKPQATQNQDVQKGYVSDISYEQAIIDAVKNASPSVVSIVISKNLPVYEEQYVNPFQDLPGLDFGSPIQIPQYVQKGTQKQEVGAGSGFIVSEDGLIITNKHVVVDKDAEYTVLTNDGKKYPAKVLALDPVQDLAIVKIEGENNFPAIKLGDSFGIQIGQGAIAIGNSLGEFRNTVSVGVISGLGRTISASGGQGFSETLEDVIQTDAAINLGNSGGPLINLKGEVIGVNTAIAEGAQSIGFAIPINIAKRDIEQVTNNNKIVYPFLGVRYVLIDDTVKDKYKLSVDYGALIIRGSSGESAITKDSAANKAGLKEKDIILEINLEKITQDNSLAKIIQKYAVGDQIKIKFLRGLDEMEADTTLGER